MRVDRSLMFSQASEFELLLQEVCSQGMQQVCVPAALLSHNLTNVPFSFQADLERLLIEFCKHLHVDFFEALVTPCVCMCLCGRLWQQGGLCFSQFMDAAATARSFAHRVK
jgi:hypothetical protein